MSKYRYIGVWFILIIAYIIIGRYNNILSSYLYAVLSAVYLIVSSYKISKRGDEIIKHRNYELYKYYYQQLGKYSNMPMFISLILLITGKYKAYTDLQDIMLEALVYCVNAIIVVISIFIILLKLIY